VTRDASLADLASQLSLGVLRAARTLRQLGHDGLSSTQNTALAMVESYGPLTIGDLAKREQVSRPTASAAVDRLESLSYLERLDDPNDGRICRVRVTRKGRAYLRMSRSRRNQWLLEQLEQLPPETLEILRTAAQVLDDIADGNIGSTERRVG
jgi:DNA-binding MarR family transcriptional regulator